MWEKCLEKCLEECLDKYLEKCLLETKMSAKIFYRNVYKKCLETIDYKMNKIKPIKWLETFLPKVLNEISVDNYLDILKTI